MARKNNLLIANMRRMQKEINSVVPNVYAGIALALHRTNGWEYEQINALFAESQRLWIDATETGENMAAKCLEETGIDVVGL